MVSAIFSTITGAMPSDGSSSRTSERIAHQRAGDGEHLLLAAAHAAAAAVGAVRRDWGISRRASPASIPAPAVPSGNVRGGWRPMSRFSATVRSAEDAAVLRHVAEAEPGDLDTARSRGNVARRRSAPCRGGAPAGPSPPSWWSTCRRRCGPSAPPPRRGRPTSARRTGSARAPYQASRCSTVERRSRRHALGAALMPAPRATVVPRPR